MTDLASLVRSIHFAAHWPRVERELLSTEMVETDGLAAWSTYWFQWMSAACIRGYRGMTENATFNPVDDTAWSVLLKALLVSRACDELSSRLGSRSDWLVIPLAGLEFYDGWASITLTVTALRPAALTCCARVWAASAERA